MGKYKDIADQLENQHKAFSAMPKISMDDAGAFLHHALGIILPQFAPLQEGNVRPLEESLDALAGEITHLLTSVYDDFGPLQETILEDLMGKLPAIAQHLADDADALFQGDPAAQSINEIIMTYPGFYAIAAHRFAHFFYTHKVPLLPRLIGEFSHRISGVDIHPGAKIGRRFFIDHATGVVIGETAIIGDNVKIYQGVTLGALKVDKDQQDKKRHPTIEDNVVIYASATILGGNTIVGHDSIIGGNVWLTKSCLPYSRIMYNASDSAESGLDWTI